jgi:16S rRNA (uracil1498-N3)-methyltransferase
MADRFYVNCELTVGPVLLEGPEAHHLRTVCRLRPGDQVCLFNGDGREYLAHVTSMQRRGVGLEVTGVAAPCRELGFRLVVAAPLPRGDRSQFLLEKLTELGVAHFVPLETERSVVHTHDAKVEKLQRYVVEASKQCGRNVLLRVEPPAPWQEYSRRSELPPRRLLGDPRGTSLRERAEPPRVVDTAIAVGPEGGFTPGEVEGGRAAGWQAVSLGPRVLRVETAAIVLAALAATGALD